MAASHSNGLTSRDMFVSRIVAREREQMHSRHFNAAAQETTNATARTEHAAGAAACELFGVWGFVLFLRTTPAKFTVLTPYGK